MATGDAEVLVRFDETRVVASCTAPLDSERPALELRCGKVSLDVSRRRRFSGGLSLSELVGAVSTEDAEVLLRFGGTLSN